MTRVLDQKQLVFVGLKRKVDSLAHQVLHYFFQLVCRNTVLNLIQILALLLHLFPFLVCYFLGLNFNLGLHAFDLGLKVAVLFAKLLVFAPPSIHV